MSTEWTNKHRLPETMVQGVFGQDKEGLPDVSLHFRNICLLIAMFSLCLVMHACTQKGDEQPAPTIAPRVHSTWVKTFYMGNILNSVCQATDGGFIAAGKTHFRQGDPDAWIVKFDAGGNVQWQRGIGEKYQDEFFSVIQTNDNGYLATGRTMSEAGAWTALIVKFTQQGDVQWQKSVPGVWLKSFFQTSDGDFILTGGSTAFGASGTALVIVRLGADGQCKWQKTYGEGDGRIVRQTSDGGYIALGSVWGLGRYETVIIKTDSAGNAQWQQQYRGPLNTIEQTTDNGFLLAGSVGVNDKQGAGNPYHFGPGNIPSGPAAVNVQGWLLKLDRDGASQWQKLYGGVFDDEFTAIRRTRDGKLIVLGNTMNYGSGNGDLWLLQLDETGTILWQKAIGGPKRDFANDLQPAGDGGYFIAATTLSFGPGPERALLAKVDNTGNVPGCTLPAFSVSNSISDDIDISPSQRPFPTQGQDVSLVLSNSTISSFDLPVSLASYFPPGPKLTLSQTVIEIGPTSRDTKNRIEMRIMNTGAAALTLKEIKITETQGSWFWLKNIRALVTGGPAPLFSVTHTCAGIVPDGYCTLTVEFKSSASGDTRASLTIVSNDPDSPILTVPVHARVL